MAARFRMNAKNIGLTWPRCDIPKERALEFLRGLAGDNLDYVIVCREQHEDEGYHLHAFLKTIRPIQTRNPRFFDLDNNHGNYETVRGMKEWINYVKKNGDWIEFGNNPIEHQKLEKKEKIEFIRTHNLEQCADSGHFSIFELGTIKRVQNQIRAEKWMWPAFEHRQVMWFYGSTGMGKTRKAVQLAERSGLSWTMLGGDLKQFFNPYAGEEFVIIDDLRAGGINFEQLLRITDGYRCTVNVKGSTEEWMAKTVIITAPKEPNLVFWNHERQEPWDKVDQLIRRIDAIRNFDEQPYGALEEDLELPNINLEEASEIDLEAEE